MGHFLPQIRVGLSNTRCIKKIETGEKVGIVSSIIRVLCFTKNPSIHLLTFDRAYHNLPVLYEIDTSGVTVFHHELADEHPPNERARMDDTDMYRYVAQVVRVEPNRGFKFAFVTKDRQGREVVSIYDYCVDAAL